jgi:thermolysin metallopeptidase-like protein
MALIALLAAAGGASADGGPKASSWTTLLDRPITAGQLDLTASPPPRKLARAALRHDAGRLRLRGSLRGLQLVSADRRPPLTTLRYRQRVGGLRVLYSQIDVAVVGHTVTSISATTVPLGSRRLRGAKHVSASEARAIARRRIAGPDSALRAQPIAFAGRPAKPRSPRRAWVVQVTPDRQPAGDDHDLTLCVVVDARSGNVLEVWKGVAAQPHRGNPDDTATGARVAQATETRLGLVRDAVFAVSAIGTPAIELYTRGNPFKFGDDDPGESTQQRFLPAGTTAASEVNRVNGDVRVVGRHICVNRGFCGRDGGFDGTFNPLSITARAPAVTKTAQTGRGTRYTNSDQRVYVASAEAGSGDILAHELGHMVDIQSGEDRVSNLGTDEVEEAMADMFAYDFDPSDPTLGEADKAGNFPQGSPRVNWATPGAIVNPVEHEPYPGHASQFKCVRTDEHFNSTIFSHAYFLFVQNVGREKAAKVLYSVSSGLGPFPGGLNLRDVFIQRAGELFGTSTRNAARSAWTIVGLEPGHEVKSTHPTCLGQD